MTERLLQYIWQFQYFNASELVTTDGQKVQVIHPGLYNTHQGPDFSNARVRISDRIWAGNVELHVHSEDWRRHAHHQDENYANVILHVVWRHDGRHATIGIPTLVLESRIPGVLLQQYRAWMESGAFIPCANYIGVVGGLSWISWKERLLVERFESRCAQIRLMLGRNNFHWEETAWWLLARNFGLFVNADAFEELARSLPYTLLARHRMQIYQLEALLLGQAGLLKQEGGDAYCCLLKKEYAHYKSKYGLQAIHSPVHFLRMRPPAFPTVRLAQLAMLLHRSGNLFSSLMITEDLRALRELLAITANDYWHCHYTFEQNSAFCPKKLGAAMVNNIIVNTVAPLVFAYGHFHQLEKHTARAMEFLSALAPENNAVVRGFLDLGVACDNAAESQALTELKTRYCDQKRCLDCAIGNSILKRGGVAHGC